MTTQTTTIEPKTRRRLSPEKRHAQLLDLAIEVAAANGIGALRHAAIAEKADVAVSTVFVYFPTSETLIESVLTEVDDFFVLMAAEAAEEAKTAQDLAQRIMRAFLKAIDDSPDYVKIVLEWSTALREGFWEGFVAFQNKILDLAGGAELEGFPGYLKDRPTISREIARSIIGGAFILALMKFSGENDRNIDQFIDTLTAPLADGV